MFVHYRHFALVCLLVTGCFDRSMAARPNQNQPSTSPSGSYVLTAPIEPNLNYDNANVWKVTISDAKSGRLLYKDNDSHFVGHLNVYWIWDQQERVWLYNSDDGVVWFWEQHDGQWTKTRWGTKRKNEIERGIAPPDMLYPQHAK